MIDINTEVINPGTVRLRIPNSHTIPGSIKWLFLLQPIR